MATQFTSMSTVAKDLAPLNQHLAAHSYVSGFAPTQHDVAALKAMTMLPSAAAHPHVTRWHTHVLSFAPAQRAVWPAEVGGAPLAPPAAAATTAPAKPADDDDFDLFGDQTEEEKKAVENKKKVEQTKQQEKKKEKKPVIGKSSLVFEITPMSSETKLEDIESMIRKVTVDGLEWG
eukprot:Selendium_serpulae@DN5407_c0_g1_i1.p1